MFVFLIDGQATHDTAKDDLVDVVLFEKVRFFI